MASSLDRPAAEVLAAELAEPNGAALARCLRAAAQAPVPTPTQRPGMEGQPRPISIWQPRQENGKLCWERPAPLPLGDHYAPRLRLHSRAGPNPRRLCLLGESVAAGYLYAPHLTPALALAHLLNRVLGAGACEVIDLARTNETLAGLADTAEAALQLAPDALVVFAGNNWTMLETPEVSPHAPGLRDKLAVAEALRAGGAPQLADLAARRGLERAGAVLAQLAGLGAAHGVPIFIVVPEVNLADWECAQPVTRLPGTGAAEWYGLLAEARRQLAAEAWEAALATATRLLRLEGGLCPTGYRLAALASLGAGRAAAAAVFARAEVDNAHFPLMLMLNAPRAASLQQGLLRAAAEHRGLACIDLPAVFAEHTGSPLPGRRLFLDYCHLTREGMHVAMAAVAEAVLRRWGQAGPDWRTLVQYPPLPLAPAAEATALFGAAIHTAHRLFGVSDKHPLLADWCAQALRAAPGISEVMLDFTEARALPVPAVFTAAQQRLDASPFALGHQHGWKYDHLDAPLLAAIGAALAAADPVAARAWPERLARYAPAARDLLPAYYQHEPLSRPYWTYALAGADEPLGLLRAYWPVSEFSFIEGGGPPAGLRLVGRLPGASSAGQRAAVRVTVNDQDAGTLALGERWAKAERRVPAGHWRRGLNTVRLYWPAPPPVSGAVWQPAIERLEQGSGADLHPSLGELCGLEVVRA